MDSKKILVLTVLLCLISTSYALTNITSLPFTASTPDTYVLTGDLNSSGSGVTISGNNITLDCQNFTMTGPYTSSTAGIINTGNNTTIINCVVKDFGNNLQFAAGDDGYVSNNTFDNANLTSIIMGTTSSVNRLNFTNNTFSNGFNNGIEYYGGQNTSFFNNICFGHEHGHGTDRCFQVVSNTNNLELAYNHFYNNTFCMRFDNNNQTNIYVHDNICENNTNGLNMQSTVAPFTNFTFINNVMLGLANNTGFDITWPAIATKATDCPQITVLNNTVTGGDYLWLNGSNSSQTLDNLDLGGLAMCDADNVAFNNLTIHGGGLGYNGAEFMLVNNVSVNGFDAIDVRVGLRILSVNDSYFANCNINGTQIGGINGNGGGANRNTVENCTVKDIRVGTGLSFGGANNTVRNIIIANSSTVSSAIGYGALGTTTNNTYDNITVSNMPLGYLITTLGVNNILQNSTFINVTQSILINSTASGTKTVTMQNITLANVSGTDPVTFDLFDTISPNELYVINWAIDPGGMNASYQSFHNKYLHTDNNGATNVSFDQLNMSWTDVEIVGYNENQLSWWYYGGSWNQLIPTPDFSNNKFSYNAYTLSPGDKFTNALFFIDDCQVINASGIYYQHRNYVNATNPSAPYLDWNCIDIRVPDVTWDCQGFNITNMGTPNTTIGVLAANSNVTVRNCNLANYSYNQYSTGSPVYAINNTYTGANADVGLSFFASSGSQIINNTFTNQGYGILFFFGTDNANVSGNHFMNNNIRGIDGGTTTGSNFEFNTFTGDNVGIALLNANTDNITSNNFTNIGFIGLQMVGTDISNVINNEFQLNSYAIDMSGGSDFNNINSNIINSTVFGSGISVSQSTGNQITFNNVTSGTSNGISTDTNSFSNVISNNNVNSNLQIGIRIEGHDETISNNVMLNNNQPGFASFNTYNLFVTNNTANANSAGFRYLNTTASNSSFNTAIGNLADGGFNVNGNGGLSSNILFTNDTAINNTGSGFQFDTDSDNNTIVNCTAQGSTGMLGSGITLAGDHGTVDGCTITDSSTTGIVISGNNSVIQNNQISGNNPLNNDVGLGFIPGGITTFSANTATISGNNIFNNPTGIGNYLSLQITTSSNTIHSNSNGLALIDSVVSLQADHYYNNGYDLFTNYTTGGSLIADGAILDNPAGTLENYSNISIVDVVTVPNSYIYNWSVQPVPTPLLPVNITSINQKYVLIQNLSSSLAINNTQFNWNSTEEANETRFLVMYYNGSSWIRPSQTLNTGSNYISFSPNTEGTYALFDNTSYVPPPAPSGGQGIGYVLQNQSPTVQFPSGNVTGIAPQIQNVQIPQICWPLAIFLIVVYLFAKDREKSG